MEGLRVEAAGKELRRRQEKQKQQPRRYWEGEASKLEEAGPPGAKKPRRKKAVSAEPGGRSRISGKMDPFPGAAVVHRERVKKFQRGAPPKLGKVSSERLRSQLAMQEEKAETAAKQAARMELLLLEEPG